MVTTTSKQEDYIITHKNEYHRRARKNENLMTKTFESVKAHKNDYIRQNFAELLKQSKALACMFSALFLYIFNHHAFVVTTMPTQMCETK